MNGDAVVAARRFLEDGGWDDVRDLENLDESEVVEIKKGLDTTGMKPGHVKKLVRAIEGLRRGVRVCARFFL